MNYLNRILNTVKLNSSAGPLLGRWSLKHKCKSQDITVIQTNTDHCGDQLCGNPQQIKQQIDNVIKGSNK